MENYMTTQISDDKVDNKRIAKKNMTINGAINGATDGVTNGASLQSLAKECIGKDNEKAKKYYLMAFDIGCYGGAE